MLLLGISAFYHDSAAAIVRDGQIVAAAQEERFTRKKDDSRFPEQAIRYCLREAGITSIDALDVVCFYDSPWLKFERILQTCMEYSPHGYRRFQEALPVWLQRKLWVTSTIRKTLRWNGPIFWCSHHESHAASAFYPSPFESAAIVTIDGVGEWTTAAWGHASGRRISMRQEVRFPHSLGLAYSAFTHFLGFTVNRDEYKVMGLAPYGRPVYAQKILDELIDLKEDGSFRLRLDYFDYVIGHQMTNGRFEELFGLRRRPPAERLTQQHMDVAASVQAVTEEVVGRIVRHAIAQTRDRRLCLAGGLALNCVANGKVLRQGLCDELWVQPAAGDAGGALGVALYAYYQHHDHPRMVAAGRDSQQGSLLGPMYSTSEVRAFLDNNGYTYRECESDAEFYGEVARLIAAGKVVGWFQGRMEFGPRALGGRSILADARRPDMQSVLNLKIKYRESFRPFAPAVLREAVSSYFESDCDSDYMLMVAPVKAERRCPAVADEPTEALERLRTPRSEVPAITHVDYSARIQTVHQDRHPRFHGLISAFERRTGCPLVINTSFNQRDEPIVESPRDAYRCFRRTAMDALALDRFVLEKEQGHATLPRTELLNDERPGDFFTIYVLGGSTAVGFPYAPEVDVGRLVACFYDWTIEGKPVRVINLASMGKPAAYSLRRVKDVSPDASLILLYPGHNEFLTPPLAGREARLTWWEDVCDYLWNRPPRPVRGAPFSEARRRAILRRYEDALDGILAHAKAIGVPILVSTAAANKSDWPPVAASVRKRANGRRVTRLIERARDAAARHRLEDAERALEDILSFEPEFALAHWMLGDCLRRQSRHQEANRHFQAAVDTDARPTRSTTADNAILRRVCERHGVPVLEYEALLDRRAAEGAWGYASFDDNCHPNLDGLATLAEGFCELMQRRLLVPGCYKRRSCAQIERLFGIDRDRAAAIQTTRIGYIFNATFLQRQWMTAPAIEEIARIARHLQAIDPHHHETIAAQAISRALAGDPGGLAAVRAAAADGLAGPANVARMLGQRAVLHTLAIYGLSTVLEATGRRSPGALARARVLLEIGVERLAPVRSALSSAVSVALFVGVVTPVGMLVRALRTARIAKTIDPAAASYWESYTSSATVSESGPSGRFSASIAPVVFLFRRRRLAPAFVLLVLLAASLLIAGRTEVLAPLIYTLF